MQQTKKMDFDVVIIGAGLTGLSAARALLGQGAFSVAIIEGEDIGSNNPSPLTFLEVLEEHELLDCIKEKYSSFAFHNYKGSSVQFSFQHEPLVVLDYKKACAEIFHRIKKDGNNLEFINQYVTAIEPNANGVAITLKNGSRPSTKLLIDASGKAQLAASRFSQLNTPYYSHVYGAFFTDVNSLDESLCCYLLPNKELGSGGGWFYSIGKNSASFGYAQITDSPKTDNKTLKTIFRTALESFKPFSDYLRGAKIDHTEKGLIPITYVDKFIYDNIIVVGDAGGMATNWTCMGIEPALKYGKLAGKLSAKAIMENDCNKLNRFQSKWEKENRSTFDQMMRSAPQFWNSDYYFWEWIIKNDLALLSPQQVIDRLRNNEHLLKKQQIIARALSYKIRSIINKKILAAKTFIIKK